MMNIAIYTLTSELHDEQAETSRTRMFLDAIGVEHELKGADYADYGTHALDVILVRTGGTEGLFKRLLPQLQRQGGGRPVYLLASHTSNSLAASMEILSYLRQQGLNGEIIHGSNDYVRHRLLMLEQVGEALCQLRGSRLGIIGQPSDWLIASKADRAAVARRLGIELVDVEMGELMKVLETTPETMPEEESACECVKQALPGAQRIYGALKTVVEQQRLDGFTLRCFDLLTAVKNTGCLALARLNAEGIVAGCEGDVPAMLSMKIVQALTGVSGFQANPSSIDPEAGEILFAHCTIPLNMVERYEFDTHFESGMGVGIRGYMKKGPVTVFKVAGDLSRFFVAEGVLMENLSKPSLCRTQQVIRLNDKAASSYFLTNPIGNHHIIVPGHWAEQLSFLLKQ